MMPQLHQFVMIVIPLVSDKISAFQEPVLMPTIGALSASSNFWVRHSLSYMLYSWDRHEIGSSDYGPVSLYTIFGVYHYPSQMP